MNKLVFNVKVKWIFRVEVDRYNEAYTNTLKMVKNNFHQNMYKDVTLDAADNRLQGMNIVITLLPTSPTETWQHYDYIKISTKTWHSHIQWNQSQDPWIGIQALESSKSNPKSCTQDIKTFIMLQVHYVSFAVKDALTFTSARLTHSQVSFSIYLS